MTELYAQPGSRTTFVALGADPGVGLLHAARAQAMEGRANPNSNYAAGSAWLPPITHTGEVWACNLSTSIGVQESVMVETGGPA